MRKHWKIKSGRWTGYFIKLLTGLWLNHYMNSNPTNGKMSRLCLKVLLEFLSSSKFSSNLQLEKKHDTWKVKSEWTLQPWLSHQCCLWSAFPIFLKNGSSSSRRAIQSDSTWEEGTIKQKLQTDTTWSEVSFEGNRNVLKLDCGQFSSKSTKSHSHLLFNEFYGI